MLLDTEISLRTLSLVPPRLTLLFLWFRPIRGVSKLLFRRVTTRKEKFRDKLVSTPVFFTCWVSSKSSLVSTRWTPLSLSHTARLDSRRLRGKSRKCLPRLDSRPRRSHSSPCPDSRVTTSLKNLNTCLGTRASP